MTSDETTPAAAPRPNEEPDSTDADESLPVVLARHARGRTAVELWTTAIGGGMNCVLLLAEFPALQWLAAGFGATMAYGAWGLADRAIDSTAADTPVARGGVAFLRVVRALVATGGVVAALVAVIGFMNAALQGLSLPGR